MFRLGLQVVAVLGLTAVVAGAKPPRDCLGRPVFGRPVAQVTRKPVKPLFGLLTAILGRPTTGQPAAFVR